MNSRYSQKRKRNSNIRMAVTNIKKTKLPDKPNNMDVLPIEIFYKIFGYITKVELATNLTRVSPKWAMIASSPLFWRNITIKNQPIPQQSIADMLETAGPNLRELTIINRSDCDWILKMAASFNKNITCLSLTRCKGKVDTKFINSNVIKSVILRLNKLEALKMFDTNFRSVKFFEIFGSRKFIISRTKTGSVKDQAITYTGVLTFRQLEAYIKNANTNGRITLHDGKEYSISRIKEILRDGTYNPNAVVRTLDEFI